MYKNRKILAIIPARGGSKGLPNKNIKDLCGKPLISYTINSAKNSIYLDEVVVSSDSQEIIDIAKKYGANTPFIRPKELATDTATSIDVVIHTINFYKDKLNQDFDYIILLEPTSPLREDDDIDNMIKLLIDNEDKYDSLCSIGEIGEHPSIVKKIVNNNLEPYCKNLELTSRRQDNKPAYFPYGVGYLTKVKGIFLEKTFYTKRNYFYKIKRHQCYEIDDIYDFLAIENIMKYKGFKDGN
jgi:CMP-N-acetylneuraminic acid synthetase